MERRGISIGTVIYLIIGLIVAANQGYLGQLTTVSGILSAILAILLWPLLLFGVNLHVALSMRATR
ncbi:MAG TPA: hypothetical protein VFH39_02705 [Candidatus Saccharimonadales bacterium]|nr:hypothetical protein [Candidatus Saccharimonadales bacterium]